MYNMLFDKFTNIKIYISLCIYTIYKLSPISLVSKVDFKGIVFKGSLSSFLWAFSTFNSTITIVFHPEMLFAILGPAGFL